MAEPALHLEGVRKTFRTGLGRRSVVAVDDLSLTVEQGSVVAFIGPNGAGKTTTIHMLLGLLRPDAGRIRLFGEPPGSVEAHRRVGFMSEIFHTYPFQTARGAIAFYGRLSGASNRGREASIPEHLARVGLDKAVDRKVGTFSKGMTQRLGLAQALFHRPELLLLDEPTTLPTVQMAVDAGEMEYVRRIQDMIVSGLFGFWTQVAFGLMGLAVMAVVMWLYHADPSLLFWIGVSRLILLGAVFSSAAVALSTVTTPFLAGIFPLFLSIINSVAAQPGEGVKPWVDMLSRGYRLLMPASMPENLLSAGFNVDYLNPPYGLYLQVLLENALYAMLLLLVGCAIFTARELRLK